MARTGASSIGSLWVCAVLVLLAGGCGPTWTQMKTRRITAYSDTPSYHRQTLERLEYAYAALSTFFPKAEVGTVEVLMWNHVDRTQATGFDREYLVYPSVPGAGKIGGRNLVVMEELGAATTARSMAVMTHLFLHKVVPNAPLWLHQGLSEYMRNTILQTGDNRWRACFGTIRGSHTFIATIPLDKLFTLSWRAYADNEGPHYDTTARLLVDFIFHGDKGVHLQKIPAIFTEAVEGIPGAQIMNSAFPGVTLAQLDKRIADFKGSIADQKERGLVCPLPMPIEPAKIPDESDPQESPVDPQEIERLMKALEKLPHGDRLPGWHPADVVAGR